MIRPITGSTIPGNDIILHFDDVHTGAEHIPLVTLGAGRSWELHN